MYYTALYLTTLAASSSLSSATLEVNSSTAAESSNTCLSFSAINRLASSIAADYRAYKKMKMVYGKKIMVSIHIT